MLTMKRLWGLFTLVAMSVAANAQDKPNISAYTLEKNL